MLRLRERPYRSRGHFFVFAAGKLHILSGGVFVNIGFVGAGKVGKALGLYFQRHGLELSGYCSRSAASAAAAAALTGTKAFPDLESLAGASEVIFITVPDLAIGEIDAAAAALIGAGAIPAGQCWIHVSGALPSDCLTGLKAAGAPVGSMHPLQSFGEPAESAERLGNTLFSIEGTEQAADIMRRVLDKTGARVSEMTAAQKPLYHAGACVVSNYLVTLLESGIRFFEAAGIDRENVFDAIRPLIDSTLSNIREKGTVDALTGPIARGDYNTLNIHLQALERQLPSETAFYRVMAEKTIEMIAGKRLTKQQEQNLLKTLEAYSEYGG